MTEDAHGSRSAEAGCIVIVLILLGIVIGLSLSAGLCGIGFRGVSEVN